MRNLCLLAVVILVLLFSTKLHSQKLEWAKQTSGFGEIYNVDIKLDGNNQIYVSGFFRGTADFDSSSNQNVITSNGGFDVFLAKYDTLGNLIWVRSFGGTSDDINRSIVIDPSGSITMVGSFESAVDFNPDPNNSFIAGSKGGEDIFISRFNSNGDWLFTIPIGGVDDDFGKEVTLDSSGNVFVTGAFRQTVNFNPSGTRTDLTSTSRDGFILALTESGGFRWVKSYPVRSFEFYFPITINQQQEVVIIKNVFDDFYIQKLSNSDGSQIWEKFIDRQFSGTYARVLSLNTDLENNIVIGGIFSYLTDLDPSSDTLNLRVPNTTSPQASFIAKYNTLGEIQFAKGIYQNNTANSFPVEIIDLEFDSKNNIHLVGAISGKFDFDPSEDSMSISSNGSIDIINAAYGPQGEFISATRTGERSRDAGIALTLDQTDAIYSAGYFSQTVDFDPDPNQLLYFTAPSVAEDGYFRKLRYLCLPSFSYNEVTECNGYRLPNGRLVLQNGTYKDTLTNKDGCDSILSFDVTLIPVDTTVTILGTQYISNANSPNTFYQWVDCNDHYSSIAGATSRTFEPVRTVGSYAVVVLENNCRDTSQCYGAAVGIEDQLFSSRVSVAPNPTNGLISIHLGDTYQNINIEVSNITGQILEEKQFTSIDQFQIELKGSKGVYLLKIITNKGETATIRVVKE